ncbi:iron(III) transport system ATP-binding protein [Peptoclostridium litorale DSM 5388]|uniref:Fe(3+) ions import ATP-binding protein FbpC 1 n=1 Tax=Peptoclostridium litorale DSM 5388 TaxID=1121324 RepID=A0A069RCC3_PEPLI|nr:ABC transporter ATP-binding protein [Peptoclostridium litorale]KDR94694.1 Fe(3+) ions import ATP-binding protein FbpC 1 [Peptoclostridium litorale DSM 5388]SIO32717.1 iron(III) transport system ATP-binding protein [Peptoclostridium litorale DSM 5388]
MYLKIENITKEFEGFRAVDDFSIEIEKGELVSLLGPSGCGKTTTLRILGGFLAPSSGRIILEGEDITGTSPEKRPVATVFQSYALFPHMNVIQNVTYGLKNLKMYSKGEMDQKGREMLDIVGLGELSGRNVTRISGGQQQRVALARALILNPKVLLMDEPLSNLDAKLRVRMRNEIKHIQKKLGITMVFVTHDQEEAMSISDRIVVMNGGRAEQIGCPINIYERPCSEFVADFIGRANILEMGASKVVVRPEHIVISSKDGRYSGAIVEKSFLGFFTSYVVNAKIDGKETLLQVDCVNSKCNYDTGDIVHFEFERVHEIEV